MIYARALEWSLLLKPQIQDASRYWRVHRVCPTILNVVCRCGEGIWPLDPGFWVGDVWHFSNYVCSMIFVFWFCIVLQPLVTVLCLHSWCLLWYCFLCLVCPACFRCGKLLFVFMLRPVCVKLVSLSHGFSVSYFLIYFGDFLSLSLSAVDCSCSYINYLFPHCPLPICCLSLRLFFVVLFHMAVSFHVCFLSRPEVSDYLIQTCFDLYFV